MKPKQLRCRDLQPGDIMLKAKDSEFLSKLIFGAQVVSGGEDPYIVHVGIMFNQSQIIEAQSNGLMINNLRGKNNDYSYVIFRCNRTDVAGGAATCAKVLFDIHRQGQTQSAPRRPGLKHLPERRGGPMRYSHFGAVGSLLQTGSGAASTPTEMDQLLTDVLEGKTHRFFCSHFVVYVYQFVAAQLQIQNAIFPTAQFTGAFPTSAAKIHPSHLATKLREAVGLFTQQGYMKSGIR
jgi:hypothetical protein